jgi:cytochrome oxidase Cu insertion factor (SCO1/SenC/PrrC family)
LRNGVYIVDPLGNVVLRYSYTDAGKPVLEDIKKLLKVSHIG